jgi:hypothetical protein
MMRAVGFARIQSHLARNDLWGFPVRIIKDERRPKPDKKPLVKWGELQSCRPSATEIAEWSQRFPDAGAGIPTGPGTVLLVGDADSPDAIEWFELRGMPETVLVRTRRGLHYYFKYPVGLRVPNSLGPLSPGIDIRGEGGFVVAAGTFNPCGDGFVYCYDQGHALGQLAIADPPGWFMKWLIAEDAKRQSVSLSRRPHQFDGQVGAWARKVIDGELETLAGAVEGTRNAR